MHPIHMNSLAPFQRAVSFGVKYRKAEGCACDAVQWQKAGTWLWKWMAVWPGNAGSSLNLRQRVGCLISDWQRALHWAEMLKRHVLGAAKEKAASKTTFSSMGTCADAQDSARLSWRLVSEFGAVLKQRCGRGGGSTLFSFWDLTRIKVKFTGNISSSGCCCLI